MKKMILSFLFFIMSGAAPAQSLYVVGELHTEGKTRYQIIGDLHRFKYSCGPVGCVLCFKAMNVVGLPELGASDKIFNSNFETDPCDLIPDPEST